jgi:hypothetical protein
MPMATFMNYRLMQNIIVVFVVFLLPACSTLETTPKNTSNLCAIFAEKTAWFDQNESVFEKWQLPVYVQMAIIWQESHFVADAKPARSKILGIIPATRPSTAYGYAQALDGTWEDYLKNSAISQASRDNFADACDFVGWYCHLSYQGLGISKQDTYNLYLAYHEGNTAYKRKSYLNKPWLLEVAKKVSSNAQQYRQQLDNCRN